MTGAVALAVALVAVVATFILTVVEGLEVVVPVVASTLVVVIGGVEVVGP